MDIIDDSKRLNPYSAIDNFVKSIETSKNEAQSIEALAAYQLSLSKLKEPWKNVPYLYGLGLLYMHFNAYRWAITAFRQALYIEPTFERSNDVHVRLGLIFKSLKNYQLSKKHLNIALDDARPCSLSSSEIKFHLAHLLEIKGNTKGAIEAYERLLQDENSLTKSLTADIHRQLGWIHLSDKSSIPNSPTTSTTPTNQKIQKKTERAVTHFGISSEAKNESRTHYYLGRCHSILGQTYDAFTSYRSIIDREETNADTWCSLGTLYQQGIQPHDAMQAYIRSVQYDKSHPQAWANLGLLYENCQRFSDALRCYQHAQQANSTVNDKSIQERIAFLQTQIPSNEVEFGRSNSGFPSLEELWNLECSTITNDRNPDSMLKSTLSCRPNSENLSKMNESLNHDISNHVHGDSNGTIPNQNDQAKHKLDDSLRNHSAGMSLNGITSSSTTATNSEQDFKNNQTTILQNGTASSILHNKLDITSTTQPSHPILMPKLSINMTAEQVIEACKNLLTAKKIDINLLSDETRPPYPKFVPPPQHNKDRLTPPPPSFFLETKKDALSFRLQEFCHSNPVVLVRNFASVLKLDLGLFSTKTLVESNSDHPTDVITHLFQAVDENLDRSTRKFVWGCECHQGQMTLSRYANYQATSLHESLREEQELGNNHGAKQSNNLARESESDSNGSASQAYVSRGSGPSNINNSVNSIQSNHQNVNCSGVNASNSSSSNASCTATNMPNSIFVSTLTSKSNNSSPNKKFKRDDTPKFVKAAFNIDLSDGKKWRPQLQELNKVPVFLRVISASNMLSHVGHEIPGVNTIQMLMQVPGCRIFGRQAENNFCSININVGPGECEWFAVPSEYAQKVSKLCSQNGVDFSNDTWWPRLASLHDKNIPVFRFIQRPGDLVWLNAGTISWMQSAGWCNSISWNVGPLIAKQYTEAAIKYECNRFEFRRSGVPMIQLTWNMAYHLNLLYDEALYTCIKKVMMKSLSYCKLVTDFIVNCCKKEIETRKLSAESTRPHVFTAHCFTCECEIFNITLTSKSDKRTHCFECARRIEPSLDTFVIKQEHELPFLMRLYDNFTLGIKPKQGLFAAEAPNPQTPIVSTSGQPTKAKPECSAMSPTKIGNGSM